MTFTDSHCHLDDLDLSKYDGKLENALKAAKDNGVAYILSACADLESFPKILEIAQTYSNVWCSVGIHPSVQCDPEPSADQLAELARHAEVIAIGECGLDYHYPDVNPAHQQERFRQQIKAAKKVQKPMIIHTRDANEDTFSILKKEQVAQLGAVIHCFTGNWNWAKQYLDLGFYIGITGIVTFKKATDVQEVAKNIPLDRLLIETDAPYLAPVPHRGKPNEPAYVRYVAEAIAAIRHISLEELASATTENFFRLFKI
ncbi:MAG: TatD family hydrolase [Gammaproteobacteria bacterium]|nr:TatD family hydrolase [Gammaproteobacteria bacterium]